MSQTGEFHWLINNLLWQLFYRASGFGFLPSSYSLLPFSRPTHLTCCSAMLIVIWVIRLEINLQEIGVFLLTYLTAVLVWLWDQIHQRQCTEVACKSLCIGAPPS